MMDKSQKPTIEYMFNTPDERRCVPVSGLKIKLHTIIPKRFFWALKLNILNFRKEICCE